MTLGQTMATSRRIICQLLTRRDRFLDDARGQFRQHFRRQNGATFAQIILDALHGNTIWQKCAKIWCSMQKLQPKICSKILAEMLVKLSSIFCAVYFMLVPLHIVHISW